MTFTNWTYQNCNGKAFCVWGFFLLFTIAGYGQAMDIDSLKKVLRLNTYDRTKKLQYLDEIAYYETNPDEKIIYSRELIESAKERDSIKEQLNGYIYLGDAYEEKGDYSTALENFFKAAKIAENEALIYKLPSVKGSLANVYSSMGDNKSALENYRESIRLYAKSNRENAAVNLARQQYNLGYFFYNNLQVLDSALYYYKKAEDFFSNNKDNDYELAYVLGSEGLVYAQLNDELIAEESLNKAISILESYEDYGAISEYLGGMSDIYLNRNQKSKALAYAQRSLELAKRNGLKREISDASLKVSSIYESLGNTARAFKTYKNHIIYRDSVNNVDMVRDIEQERAKYELEKEEQKTKLAKEQAKTARVLNIGIGIVVILIAVLAFFLFRRNKFISETNKIIEKEKQRSEDLLMNILPEETAQELKEKGSVEARKYESVSVLFTDFKGFTEYSELLSPEDLVKSIDYYFSNFDKIMEKYGIEKIKTVGDAYMCASGLPFPAEEHCYKITLAALEIIEFINQTKFINQKSLAKFDIRVGIHTGPVVAGVVGTKKFAYDIWGDTVNTASRMESSGAVGRVNISEASYNILKRYDEFSFEPRGAIQAKGKGEIHMYFVSKNVF